MKLIVLVLHILLLINISSCTPKNNNQSNSHISTTINKHFNNLLPTTPLINNSTLIDDKTALDIAINFALSKKIYKFHRSSDQANQESVFSTLTASNKSNLINDQLFSYDSRLNPRTVIFNYAFSDVDTPSRILTVQIDAYGNIFNHSFGIDYISSEQAKNIAINSINQNKDILSKLNINQNIYPHSTSITFNNPTNINLSNYFAFYPISLYDYSLHNPLNNTIMYETTFKNQDDSIALYVYIDTETSEVIGYRYPLNSVPINPLDIAYDFISNNHDISKLNFSSNTPYVLTSSLINIIDNKPINFDYKLDKNTLAIGFGLGDINDLSNMFTIYVSPASGQILGHKFYDNIISINHAKNLALNFLRNNVNLIANNNRTLLDAINIKSNPFGPTTITKQNLSTKLVLNTLRYTTFLDNDELSKPIYISENHYSYNTLNSLIYEIKINFPYTRYIDPTYLYIDATSSEIIALRSRNNPPDFDEYLKNTFPQIINDKWNNSYIELLDSSKNSIRFKIFGKYVGIRPSTRRSLEKNIYDISTIIIIYYNNFNEVLGYKIINSPIGSTVTEEDISLPKMKQVLISAINKHIKNGVEDIDTNDDIDDKQKLINYKNTINLHSIERIYEDLYLESINDKLLYSLKIDFEAFPENISITIIKDVLTGEVTRLDYYIPYYDPYRS